jgi:hypothetical protein
LKLKLVLKEDIIPLWLVGGAGGPPNPKPGGGTLNGGITGGGNRISPGAPPTGIPGGGINPEPLGGIIGGGTLTGV